MARQGAQLFPVAVAQGVPTGAGGLAGLAWSSMGLDVRGTLALLALDDNGRTPEETARTRWDVLSDGDRDKMGALARHLLRELAPAAALR